MKVGDVMKGRSIDLGDVEWRVLLTRHINRSTSTLRRHSLRMDSVVERTFRVCLVVCGTRGELGILQADVAVSTERSQVGSISI